MQYEIGKQLEFYKRGSFYKNVTMLMLKHQIGVKVLVSMT